MTTRILDYIRHHAIAVTALVCSILAMAGSSYAAFTINGRQIVNHTISPSKFDPKFINGSVRGWAVVDPRGHVVAGAGGPHIGSTGIPALYEIRWRVTLPVGACDTSATIDMHLSPGTEQVGPNTFPSGWATASTQVFLVRRLHVGETRVAKSFVQTFNQSGQATPLGFDVAVIC